MEVAERYLMAEQGMDNGRRVVTGVDDTAPLLPFLRDDVEQSRPVSGLLLNLLFRGLFTIGRLCLPSLHKLETAYFIEGQTVTSQVADGPLFFSCSVGHGFYFLSSG